MKIKQQNKMKLAYFITSIWAFGLAIGRESTTAMRQDLRKAVFFYNAPNKTDTSGIQPRIDENTWIPRRQSQLNPAPGNVNKPTITGRANLNTNARSVRKVQNAPEVPILIYRGPHRPRVPYYYSHQTIAKIEKNPNYIGASSRNVAIKGIGSNDRFQNPDKNSKQNSKDSLVPTPFAVKERNLPSKRLYEDISILKEPHVESTLGRPTSSYYYVPEKQNYDIHSGGMYDNEHPDIESHYEYETAASKPTYVPSNTKYSPIDRSSNSQTKIKTGSGTNRRNSNASRSRKLYSRNYDLKNITPPSLTIHHPANDDQFEVMDHYDGGFSVPKPKRQSSSLGPGSRYQPSNFGLEFDYEDYDSYVRPNKRLHRASNIEQGYDDKVEPSIQENPVTGPTTRPVQNTNRRYRNGTNGRRRSRNGHRSTTKISSATSSNANPTQVASEIQMQSGTNSQRNANYRRPQSPSSNPGRKIGMENHAAFATTAEIESTYANVEIRRTQAITGSDPSNPRLSGRNQRRRTTGRVPVYRL